MSSTSGSRKSSASEGRGWAITKKAASISPAWSAREAAAPVSGRVSLGRMSKPFCARSCRASARVPLPCGPTAMRRSRSSDSRAAPSDLRTNRKTGS